MADPNPDVIRYERGEDGVVVLTMDRSGRSVNTLDQVWTDAFLAAVERLRAERDEITGVIVTSAKEAFSVGGDVNLLQAIRPQDAAAFTVSMDALKAGFRGLETLGRPVVAALNGSALGGGLEIALACHHRIALDAPGSRFGFPEVTLGLLPGAGGVTRSVRMLGVVGALTAVLLEGRRFRPAAAVEAGLVDELAGSPQELLARARAWIAEHPDAVQPWDAEGYRMPGGTPANPSLAAMLPALPATLRKQLKGSPLPAPRAILAAAVEGAGLDIVTAGRVETQYLASLATGQVAKNMIQAFFFDLQAINGGGSRPAGYEPRPATKVAVIGAGMMGAGIAYQCAVSGLDVVLKDVSPQAAANGKAYSERLLAKAVGRGTRTRAGADAILARITPTAEVGDLAGCDAMIEAVFENPELKARVYAESVPQLAPDALLGSNTSSLPITGLAGGVDRPEDFIGLHFFSPVDRMPLLEIVVGELTSDATLARALDLARQIGKTPIVVNDSRGFFTSRVIGRFITEAILMLAEGIPAASIEQAALQAGYPTGPLALADEVSLKLMHSIRASAGAAPASPSDALVDRMVSEFERPGRAGGAGFYDYAGGRRGLLWPGLAEHFGRPEFAAGGGIAFADLQERMLFAEALDSVRCLDEDVLRSVADANVGSILGIGFPAWTGGVLQYVDQYAGGVAGFVARARELAGRYGERFEPPASLVVRAEGSGAAA